MSKPAGVVHVHANFERLIDGLSAVDREHRKQFLDRQGMFATHTLNRRDQEFGVRLHGKTDHAGDIGGFLADCHRLHESGFGVDHRARQQRRLFLVADVRAQLREFPQHPIINLIIDHHRLLRSANRSIVEGLGGDDVYDGHIQIGRPFQIDRRIARAHAKGWLAGAIGGLNGARSTGGINQADILVMHEVSVVLQGVRFQARENAFRCAVLHRRLVHDPDSLVATVPGVRVRAEDNSVPGLDGHDAFEENRRGRVRNWREREDDADRIRHLHQIALWKFANGANGAFVLYVVVDKLRGHHVLKGLGFHNPELQLA